MNTETQYGRSIQHSSCSNLRLPPEPYPQGKGEQKSNRNRAAIRNRRNSFMQKEKTFSNRNKKQWVLCGGRVHSVGGNCENQSETLWRSFFSISRFSIQVSSSVTNWPGDAYIRGSGRNGKLVCYPFALCSSLRRTVRSARGAHLGPTLQPTKTKCVGFRVMMLHCIITFLRN